MPTHRIARAENREDRIRFKNLMRAAERRLTDAGFGRRDAKELLQPAARYLEDTLFWQHQSDGLALFLSPEVQRLYRLPIAFEEFVDVADRFQIRPLLRLLLTDGHFYLLALSQNHVRLMEGSRHSLDEIEPGSVPVNLRESLTDRAVEKQLQLHVGTRASLGGSGAIFHGHGAGAARTKDLLLPYFRQIDEGLGEVLREERAPLVLAGVAYYFSIYRAANTYPFLITEGIPGNPEGQRPEELHEQAWSLVEPLFRQEMEKAAETYRELTGTGRTSRDVREVAEGASHGRVDVLLLALDPRAEGPTVGAKSDARFQPDSEPPAGAGDRGRHRPAAPTAPRPAAQMEAGAAAEAEKLLELAAAETLLHGGRVFALSSHQLPEASSPVAAILRY